ncbi:diguanylate cyclase, partial [Halobacillus litoralis]
FRDPTISADNPRTIELRLKSRGSARGNRHFEITAFPMEDESGAPGEAAFQIYGTARDITERKEAEAFINFQAYHDLLTRLPNRALFKDRLGLSISQAERNNQKLAVMFIDLDRFKVVNDSLGHAMGDRLLQAVTQRLEGCLRQGDTLSRFGGDEFTLLLPEIRHADDARTIARKLMEAL